jgi:DNA-binding response OmpR family regulator
MASILFIDDDQGSRMLYKKASVILGHDSILADNGQLGLDLAKARQPDLIILDLSLPDLDGMLVLSKLKIELTTKPIPVVVVSAGVNEMDEELARSNGATAYLLKPISLDKLQSAIDKYAIVIKNEKS